LISLCTALAPLVPDGRKFSFATCARADAAHRGWNPVLSLRHFPAEFDRMVFPAFADLLHRAYPTRRIGGTLLRESASEAGKGGRRGSAPVRGRSGRHSSASRLYGGSLQACNLEAD